MSQGVNYIAGFVTLFGGLIGVACGGAPGAVLGVSLASALFYGGEISRRPGNILGPALFNPQDDRPVGRIGIDRRITVVPSRKDSPVVFSVNYSKHEVGTDQNTMSKCFASLKDELKRHNAIPNEENVELRVDLDGLSGRFTADGLDADGITLIRVTKKFDLKLALSTSPEAKEHFEALQKIFNESLSKKACEEIASELTREDSSGKVYKVDWKAETYTTTLNGVTSSPLPLEEKYKQRIQRAVEAGQCGVLDQQGDYVHLICRYSSEKVRKLSEKVDKCFESTRLQRAGTAISNFCSRNSLFKDRAQERNAQKAIQDEEEEYLGLRSVYEHPLSLDSDHSRDVNDPANPLNPLNPLFKDKEALKAKIANLNREIQLLESTRLFDSRGQYRINIEGTDGLVSLETLYLRFEGDVPEAKVKDTDPYKFLQEFKIFIDGQLATTPEIQGVLEDFRAGRILLSDRRMDCVRNAGIISDKPEILEYIQRKKSNLLEEKAKLEQEIKSPKNLLKRRIANLDSDLAMSLECINVSTPIGVGTKEALTLGEVYAKENEKIKEQDKKDFLEILETVPLAGKIYSMCSKEIANKRARGLIVDDNSLVEVFDAKFLEVKKAAEKVKGNLLDLEEIQHFLELFMIVANSAPMDAAFEMERKARKFAMDKLLKDHGGIDLAQIPSQRALA